MTTPHDDERRSELLDVPDHRPDFWAALDTDLASEDRENVVPLATAPSARLRGRGVLLAAAVLAVLGGIGAYFALAGDDDGPDVAVDPEPSVTTAPDPTTPPTTLDPALANVVESFTATVERVSEVGPAGTFSLAADDQGTIMVGSDELELGYHAPSGATWRKEGDSLVSEIDPIGGRRAVESLLMLDLAEAVKYGEHSTAGDGQTGRIIYEATVDLTDNESAGWFDRTASVYVDDGSGFVMDATVTDGSGEVVEELRMTDVEWSLGPVDVSGVVGVESDWAVTEGLPADAVIGDGYFVPEGLEPIRTFTTDAGVPSGAEAGNPEADGAYVIDVTTVPWHHSKIVVFGRTPGEWKDPLASEGWFTQPESVTPDAGVLAGIEGELVATPPQRPRVWFDLPPTEVVAIDGLIGPATAEQLWNLAPAEGGPEEGAVVPDAVPAPDEGSLIENGPMITDGDTLWFTVGGDLTRFDLATREITGAVSMPDVLGSLRVGRSISFLDGSGTLSDVDLGSLTTIHTVDVPGLRTISWLPVNKDGAIWFGSSDTIQRVLRETGEETHRFEVEPESFGFATDDAFWSVGSTELLRIDFATFEVTRTPLVEELPRFHGQGASAEDDGGLWVGQASAEDDGGLWVATLESSTISVQRIDLQSGAVGPSIAVSVLRPSDHLGANIPLVVEKGALWVSGLPEGGVVRVDLSTFEVIEVPGKGAEWRTANVIGEEIWVEGLDSLLRLDPTTAAIVETLELAPGLQEEDGFGWLPVDGEVWVVDSSLTLRAIPRR